MDVQASNGGFDSVELTDLGIALAGTAAITALILVWQIKTQTQSRRACAQRAGERAVSFATPMAWFAIRSEDGARVCDVMGLEAPAKANWQSGVAALREEGEGASRVFISPPIDGWILVAGLALPHPVGPRFVDKCLPLMEELARHFADVQYFCCFPAIDHYGWARAREGKLIRAFALGDEGLIWNRGRPSRDERLLGLKLFEIKEDARRGSEAALGSLFDAGEGHVVRLAGKWGIDPMRLAERKSVAAGPCLLASAPASWRMERAAQPRRRISAQGAQA